MGVLHRSEFFLFANELGMVFSSRILSENETRFSHDFAIYVSYVCIDICIIMYIYI